MYPREIFWFFASIKSDSLHFEGTILVFLAMAPSLILVLLWNSIISNQWMITSSDWQIRQFSVLYYQLWASEYVYRRNQIICNLYNIEVIYLYSNNGEAVQRQKESNFNVYIEFNKNQPFLLLNDSPRQKLKTSAAFPSRDENILVGFSISVSQFSSKKIFRNGVNYNR